MPLLAAFRALQLPVAAEQEDKALEAFVEFLNSRGITGPDQLVLVFDETAQWMAGQPNTPHVHLVGAVKAALEASDSQWGRRFSEVYFKAHKDLQAKRGLSARYATVLLSQLREVVFAATESHMSCARIAVVLGMHRIDWQEVQVVLLELGLNPNLDAEEAHATRTRDFEVAEALLADADIDEASRLVAEAAERLGFPSDLHALLQDVSTGSDSAAHIPYMQILYFQCLILEFYNHVPSALYEFSPRGALVGAILEEVFGDLATAQNPFLNNAKGVAVLDRDWARARRPKELRQATALAEIIVGLDQLGLYSQRDLAAWLRCWVLRYVQLSRAPMTTLPVELSQAQLVRAAAAIGAHPSETAGILEQRFVDAYAYLQHSETQGWRARGLGDSVNASNLSRRKLGDCDFQNAASREIVSYEAHGGALTARYFEGHRATLRAALRNRVEELESIADRSEWAVKVVFVATSFTTLANPREEDIEGVRVRYEFVTIGDALDSLDLSDPAVRSEFSRLVMGPLRERKTPDRVRQKLLSLTAP